MSKIDSPDYSDTEEEIKQLRDDNPTRTTNGIINLYPGMMSAKMIYQRCKKQHKTRIKPDIMNKLNDQSTNIIVVN